MLEVVELEMEVIKLFNIIQQELFMCLIFMLKIQEKSIEHVEIVKVDIKEDVMLL